MTGRLLSHVAIADDWESSVAIGSYESATHGRSLDEVGYIHATTAEAIQHVLDSEYVHIVPPLVLVVLDSDEIDVSVDWERRLAPAEPGGVSETAPVDYGPSGTAVGRKTVFAAERRNGDLDTRFSVPWAEDEQ